MRTGRLVPCGPPVMCVATLIGRARFGRRTPAPNSDINAKGGTEWPLRFADPHQLEGQAYYIAIVIR